MTPKDKIQKVEKVIEALVDLRNKIDDIIQDTTGGGVSIGHVTQELAKGLRCAVDDDIWKLREHIETELRPEQYRDRLVELAYLARKAIRDSNLKEMYKIAEEMGALRGALEHKEGE